MKYIVPLHYPAHHRELYAQPLRAQDTRKLQRSKALLKKFQEQTITKPTIEEEEVTNRAEQYNKNKPLSARRQDLIASNNTHTTGTLATIQQISTVQ